MRILHLEASRKPRAVEIRAIVGDTEFSQLLSHLDNLCVFATQTISEPATAIKTGARHSYAKYLLLPVKLRRQFRTDEFDFEKIETGAVKYRDKLYVIYGIPKKGGVVSSEDENRH